VVLLNVEAYKRSLAERVHRNRAILTNPYWFLPVDDKGHEEYVPVGRGKPSSDWCGKHRSFVVCKDVEAHKGVVINGVDFTGKVVVRHQHFWCKNASCSVCFNRGWSVRGAKFIVPRLEEGVKRGFGKIEHVVVSVSKVDRDRISDEKVLRKKCRDAVKDRGVIGGVMIFHGFRVDRERKCLKWSPHYHILGFIGNGGFDRCRSCVHKREDCRFCDGFKGREVRGYAKDGYLVKVLAERKTVFGTAWYQLNHATIRVGVKRFYAVTWFGVCGYSNFKREKVSVDVEVPCPVCGGEMTRCFYAGKRFIAKDVGDVDYEAWFGDEVFGGRGFG
jgi:hypothetical protein